MHREEGKYDAFVFKDPIFNKEQPRKLHKNFNVSLIGDGCGFHGINMNKIYEKIEKVYLDQFNHQIVGLSNIEIESYMVFIGITVIPCLRVKANPLIVEKPPILEKVFPLEISY